MIVTQIKIPTSAMRGQYAGFVSRAIAFLIDLLSVVFVQFLTVLIIRLSSNFLGLTSILNWLDSMLGIGTGITSNTTVLVSIRIVTVLSGVIIFNLYVATSWALVDKTLGQALLGLRVLRTNGTRLTFPKAIKRAVGYILSALPLFLGFLWVLIDDRRQGWHDKLADTVVVYDWDARLGALVREWSNRRQDLLQADLAGPIKPPAKQG